MTENITYTFYEIVCKDEDKDFIYVGSTKDFKNRKYQHKTVCNNKNLKGYNLQIYQFIRENGGWENFNMNPVEILDCETKTHARIREQYWIEQKKANLNKFKAYRTEEQKKEYYKEQTREYYEQNKEKIKEQTREYREKNKEKIKEQTREYREQNKEKIKEYREQTKDKNKEYREKNKEKIKEQNREYYLKKKETE